MLDVVRLSPREAFRSAVLGELGPAIFRGFIASYYRTFAVPQIAAELLRHGESRNAPAKRATDTAIVIYEIISHPDGQRAQEMLSLLRRVHRGVQGDNEDYEYVLYSLLCVPVRFLERYGSRTLTDEEIKGGVELFTHIGRSMGIKRIRHSFQEWQQFSAAYEGAHVSRTQASDLLVESSMPVLEDKLPKGLRWSAPRVLSALVMDDLFQGALALPAPGIGRLIVKQTLRHESKKTEGLFFTPGRGGSGTYPRGYQLRQIGPTTR